MPNPTSHSSWQKLIQLQSDISNTHLNALFSSDSSRFQKYSLEMGNLFVDYSKNFINEPILDELFQLADNQHLQQTINGLLQANGSASVAPVPYTSLRDPGLAPLIINGKDITGDIRNTKFRMNRICDDIRSWKWRGFSDKPITDVVTLGVGGAANGTEAVTLALKPFQTTPMNFHFIANADSEAMGRLLNQLQPDTTLFIISSKSFSTQETLQNANLAKQWVSSTTRSQEAIKRHFLAITSQSQSAQAFGIPEENILPVWNWLPGRYSLWSAAGLPIALAIGMERFDQLLAGAHKVDEHFASEPMPKNLPVVLGLLSVWYINFWNASHHAVLPYTEALELFPGFVQHSLMEANGKSVDIDGNKVNYDTAPVIWGTAGSSSQHTYFQLLHQGTHIIPADFIIAISQPVSGSKNNAFKQLLAQTEALMMGDLDGKILDQAAPLREQILPGNKPSTTILMKELSPYSLGQLLALYEHIAIVQSIIWNINPFSHWGTELSKRYSSSFSERNNGDHHIQHDPSTLGLLEQFKRWRYPTETTTEDSLQAEREENSYPFF